MAERDESGQRWRIGRLQEDPPCILAIGRDWPWFWARGCVRWCESSALLKMIGARRRGVAAQLIRVVRAREGVHGVGAAHLGGSHQRRPTTLIPGLHRNTVTEQRSDLPPLPAPSSPLPAPSGSDELDVWCGHHMNSNLPPLGVMDKPHRPVPCATSDDIRSVGCVAHRRLHRNRAQNLVS